MFKNKTIIGLICIVLSVAVILVVSPLIQKAAIEKKEIVRVTADITQGTKLTKDNTEVVEVSAYNLPAGILSNTKDVYEKYSTVDMKAGDYFVKSKLSETSNATNSIFKNMNKRGLQAFSVNIDLTSSLSGKIKKGDIVRIYHVEKDKETKADKVVSPPECQYLYVVTTTTKKGVDAEDLKPNKDGTYELPATVTILANSEQVKILQKYNSDNTSKTAFSLIYRGKETEAEKYLQEQEKYFKTGKINTSLGETNKNDNSKTSNSNNSNSIMNYRYDEETGKIVND